MYHADLDQDLHQLPKLTVDHIYLTSFSKMKVCLAAQVLSNTVGTALRRHYPDGEGEETAKFCEMLNKSIDCLNIRSTTEHTRKRNECLAPYSSLDDWRFAWLQNVILACLGKSPSGMQFVKNPFQKESKLNKRNCSTLITVVRYQYHTIVIIP